REPVHHQARPGRHGGQGQRTRTLLGHRYGRQVRTPDPADLEVLPERRSPRTRTAIGLPRPRGPAGPSRLNRRLAALGNGWFHVDTDRNPYDTAEKNRNPDR